MARDKNVEDTFCEVDEQISQCCRAALKHFLRNMSGLIGATIAHSIIWIAPALDGATGRRLYEIATRDTGSAFIPLFMYAAVAVIYGIYATQCKKSYCGLESGE